MKFVNALSVFTLLSLAFAAKAQIFSDYKWGGRYA
jgi:hypothetical protein